MSKSITLEQLEELINNIDSNAISYLLYKVDREQYKKLFNNKDDFNKIDQLIEHLKVFAEDLNHMNHNDVKRIIYSVHYLLQYLGKKYNNSNYVSIINKIYNALQSNNEFKQIFEKYPYLYHDFVNNSDKYPIDANMDIMDIHNYIEDIYNEEDVDEMFTHGINFNYLDMLNNDPEYVNAMKLFCDHQANIIQLSDNDYFKYLNIKNKKEEEAKIKAEEQNAVERVRIKYERENRKNLHGGYNNINNMISECKSNPIYKLVKKN